MPVTKLVFPPGRLRRRVRVLDLMPVAVPEAAASCLRVFLDFLALHLQVQPRLLVYPLVWQQCLLALVHRWNLRRLQQQWRRWQARRLWRQTPVPSSPAIAVS